MSGTTALTESAAAEPVEGASATTDDQSPLSLLTTMVVSTRKAMASLESIQLAELAAAAAMAHERAAESGSGHDTEMAYREVAAELAVGMRVSDRTVQRQMSEAVTIVEGFPISYAALSEGTISRAHLTVIVEAGLPIPAGPARAEFERAAVARAECTTPGRLRTMVEALADDAHPRTLVERHQEARAARCVTVRPLVDGMSELCATLPTVLAKGIHDRLTRQAHALRDGAVAETRADGAPSDDRTLDQLRADLFCDLLLTGSPQEDAVPLADRTALGSIRAVVHVTVPAETVHGESPQPGRLSGAGLVDPDTVRALAGWATGWDQVHTHPETGAVLAVDRYRPSKALTRFLRARDEHCRFPGCRVATVRCDIDHTIDAAHGGQTSAENLAHLCRRHHTLKHATRWRVVQHPGGVLEWTSPTGATYVDKPPGEVRFEPAPELPTTGEPEPPPF